MSASRPRRGWWASRWWVFAFAVAGYIAVMVVAMVYLGGIALALGLLGALVVPMVIGSAMEDERRRGVAERFSRRPGRPLAEQAKELIAGRGLEATPREVASVVACWMDLGRFLRIDPMRLRAEDDLVTAFGEHAASLDGPARAGEAPLSGREERCRYCDYDLSGLDPDARCPECGRERVPVRTLGDYVLYASGVLRADRGAVRDGD